MSPQWILELRYIARHHQELSEYKYDGKGNTIEDNYTETEDGAVTYTEKRAYEYDNKGNRIK